LTWSIINANPEFNDTTLEIHVDTEFDDHYYNPSGLNTTIKDSIVWWLKLFMFKPE